MLPMIMRVIKYMGVTMIMYSSTYKTICVEWSIPKKAKTGGLRNNMDVPVIPKMQKTSQNWKLL